jgi:nitroreductase
MTRAFIAEPVQPSVLDQVLETARRAPSAGNAASVQFLVLTGHDVHAYWDVTLPVDKRASFPWPGLLIAPCLVIPFVEPAAYVRRYAEPDKARTGLGEDEDAWSTPYWWVDGGMAAMSVLLGAEEAGLGALFFGLFEHESAVRRRFGVPDGRRAIGSIAIGSAAPNQRPSISSGRPRPSLSDVVHRGGWAGTDQE